jgi:uncharacterized protein YjbI with pentapeptide repeats
MHNGKTPKHILEQHKLWVEGKGGERANLRDADLRYADLSGANLRNADLIVADLSGAYLRDADLRGADLRGADLRGADLRGAYLRGAYLRGAYLRGADLRDADLRNANLRGADLRDADLRDADLRGADLRGADLRGAYLRGADLRGAYLPNFQLPPSEGSFIAWKKTTKGVAKIKITEDAKRTSSLIGRKCRASKIEVLEGFEGATGPNYGGLIYETGAVIEVEDYDDDIRVECTRGIHFFMTKKEAEEW